MPRDLTRAEYRQIDRWFSVLGDMTERITALGNSGTPVQELIDLWQADLEGLATVRQAYTGEPAPPEFMPLLHAFKVVPEGETRIPPPLPKTEQGIPPAPMPPGDREISTRGYVNTIDTKPPEQRPAQPMVDFPDGLYDGVIDRIEGDFAVVELSNSGLTFNVRRGLIAGNLGEGARIKVPIRGGKVQDTMAPERLVDV